MARVEHARYWRDGSLTSHDRHAPRGAARSRQASPRADAVGTRAAPTDHDEHHRQQTTEDIMTTRTWMDGAARSSTAETMSRHTRTATEMGGR